MLRSNHDQRCAVIDRWGVTYLGSQTVQRNGDICRTTSIRFQRDQNDIGKPLRSKHWKKVQEKVYLIERWSSISLSGQFRESQWPCRSFKAKPNMVMVGRAYRIKQIVKSIFRPLGPPCRACTRIATRAKKNRLIRIGFYFLNFTMHAHERKDSDVSFDPNPYTTTFSGLIRQGTQKSI